VEKLLKHKEAKMSQSILSFNVPTRIDPEAADGHLECLLAKDAACRW
jgi:hypothetical protein